MHGKDEKCVKILFEKPKPEEKRPLEDLSVDGRIILKCV
jgi:hypothetical protein